MFFFILIVNRIVNRIFNKQNNHFTFYILHFIYDVIINQMTKHYSINKINNFRLKIIIFFINYYIR